MQPAAKSACQHCTSCIADRSICWQGCSTLCKKHKVLQVLLLSKQNGQQEASSPVPLSCCFAHQQALPHWPCALRQVEPTMHSCMSASKVCSASNGTEKCSTLTRTACLAFCTAAEAACILLMSEAFSANAACRKLDMSALHKLYCS
jgi:hypothetical protein